MNALLFSRLDPSTPRRNVGRGVWAVFVAGALVLAGQHLWAQDIPRGHARSETMQAPDVPKRPTAQEVVALLQEKIRRLQAENDLLQQDNAKLRQELDALKAAAAQTTRQP